MLSAAYDIFTAILLPVLAIVLLGAVLQWSFRLHIPTLSRLNVYLLVPAFLFVRVFDSTLGWSQVGGIVGAVVLPMVLLGAPMWWLLRARRAEGPAVAALVVGGLAFNAGNVGIPIAELLYQGRGVLFAGMTGPSDGVAVQAIVVMVTNLSVWGVGYMVLALAKGDGVRGAASYFKLPTIYVLIAAFVLRDTGATLPKLIDFPLRTLAGAAVPLMLLTLGAQLVQRARWPNWRLVLPAMTVKLAALPAVTFATVWALGMWPWPGAQLVIAASAPTAVNTLLLTLELDGDADLAADIVFWTTLASAGTVTVVMSLVTAQALAS